MKGSFLRFRAWQAGSGRLGAGWPAPEDPRARANTGGV
jgi:hypothetical protein